MDSKWFSDESYGAPDARRDYEDFKYQEGFSDKRRAVWHNDKTGQTHIGYRGSVDAHDWYVDLLDPKGNILTGTEGKNPMFKRDLRHFDKVSGAFGNDVKVSGHSLGGTRAINVSRKRNVEGEVYNAGSSPLGKSHDKTCSSPSPPEWCSKMTRHTVVGDPVSIFQGDHYGKKNFYKWGRGVTPHHTDSFRPRFQLFV